MQQPTGLELFAPFRGRLLLQLAAAFCFGIFVAAWLPFWVSLAAAALLAAALRSGWGAAAALFLLLGAARYTGELQRSPQDINLKPSPSLINATGVVASDPRSQFETTRFQFRVETADGKPANGLVMVQSRGDSANLRFGDRLNIQGELVEPEPARNPGEFDYQGYLRVQGIERLLRATRMNSAGERERSLPAWAADRRADFLAAMHRTLPPQQAETAAGLVMGAQSETPDDLKDAMRRTGAYHLLSVSGTHVVALSLVAVWLLGLAGVSKIRAVWTLLPALALYALVTGGSAPVVRSALMVGLFYGAYLVRRQPDALTAMAGAALLSLLWQPRVLFDASFQLSFVTVGGMALLYGPIFRSLRPIPLRWVRVVLGASLAASIASAPLVVYYFQSVSLIGPLVNLALAYPVMLLLALGTALWLMPAAAPLLAWPLSFVLWLFLWVIAHAAHLPFAALETPLTPAWLPALLLFLLVALAPSPSEDE